MSAVAGALEWPAFVRKLGDGRAGGRCECDGRCADRRCAGGRCIERHQRRSPMGGRAQAVAVLTLVYRHGPQASRPASRNPDDYVVLCQHCREGLS
ncbi:hypothetical protein [Aeromicrobium sp. Leaf291]|uniref:hypothetical protein n=1 Tax=Aeromicrobium sp. Leaf291 TaxID=1736325 RepID=UPI0006FD8F12|nr:hypothetical protein [Aeromicrobium sp. Leaf291]KQP81615.1 hypothetical protein ASF35_16420 [Aeromicrobium sp. Leaf291]